MAGAAILLLVLVWGAIGAHVLMFHDNHLAWGLEVLTPLFLLATLIGAVRALIRRRMDGVALVLILAGSGSIGGVIALDRFNVLVQYDTWLKRGMPERPF